LGRARKAYILRLSRHIELAIGGGTFALKFGEDVLFEQVN